MTGEGDGPILSRGVGLTEEDLAGHAETVGD